ncbi:hypothetical protein DPMN_129217 [Dreissena polymorpha]|uniref:Uncharacterized protein n=1 Tax=Dreissena polymorpha TaxID=45954 RepID=A0A9D4JX57_DREPO|nr:hypothetical protein DPMN_129217 [Dreissena polymorpha]
MSANTSRQDVWPICKDEIDILKNNWGANKWNGVKGINEASVKWKYNLVSLAFNYINMYSAVHK